MMNQGVIHRDTVSSDLANASKPVRPDSDPVNMQPKQMIKFFKSEEMEYL